MSQKPTHRKVYVLRDPLGREWARVLYPGMAQDIADRESGIGLSVHEEQESLDPQEPDPMGILIQAEQPITEEHVRGMIRSQDRPGYAPAF